MVTVRARQRTMQTPGREVLPAAGIGPGSPHTPVLLGAARFGSLRLTASMQGKHAQKLLPQLACPRAHPSAPRRGQCANARTRLSSHAHVAGVCGKRSSSCGQSEAG